MTSIYTEAVYNADTGMVELVTTVDGQIADTMASMSFEEATELMEQIRVCVEEIREAGQ